MRKIRICFLAAALSSFLLSQANAYVFEGLIWGVPTTPMIMNLSASQGQLGSRLPRFPLQDGSGSFNQVFGNAISSWNSYLGDLQIVAQNGSNSQGVNENDNISETGFGTTAGGTNLDANTLAVTEIFYYVGTNNFALSFIVFNSSSSAGFYWNSYRGPLQNVAIDMRRVALHELGHFIGLDHPDQAGQNVNAIMNSVISDTDNLTSDDIAGGTTLYWSSLGRMTQPAQVGDFDGDGNTDLLWRNVTNGDVAIWLMNGSTILNTGVVSHPAMTWRIVTLADLTSQGKTGIVWLNLSTGGYAIWYLNGTSLESSSTVNLPVGGYPVVFFGNVEHLGQTDAVQWSPSSGSLVMSRGVNSLDFSQTSQTIVSTDWALVGLADVQGNGSRELVWRSQSTGKVAIWFLTTNFQLSSSVVVGALSASWSLRGIGRFNGSTNDNLLWQNSVTGEVAIWNLNTNGTINSATVISGRAADPWGIFATPKVSASNNSHLFWFNLDSYRSAIWFINGSSFTPRGIAASPSRNWVLEPAGF
jgi:Matrixin